MLSSRFMLTTRRGDHVKFLIALLVYASAIVWASAGEPAGVASLSSEWATDWSAKNLDAVMTLYAPNAVFLPTVGPRWEGLAAIRKNCAELQATYNPDIKIKSLASQTSGDLAYDGGTYDETLTPVKAGKPIHASGSYLFVFQRQKSGSWKILEQTFTMTTDIKL